MSRFLDERGRLFGKVNVVDLLVLVMIVAVVVLVAVRFTGWGVAAQPIKVTFRAESIRNADAKTLQQVWKPGTTIRDESGTVVLGKVESIEVAQTLLEYITPQGELRTFASTVLSDVTLVVRGQGTVSNGLVHVGAVSVSGNDRVILTGNGHKRMTVVATVVWGKEAEK